ncbi:MAG: cation:proton antiporter, partial [Thermoguttaceae bacterium]
MGEEKLIGLLMIKLLFILASGLIAGIICKRAQVPLVIGYLIAGAFLGFFNSLTKKNVDTPDNAPAQTVVTVSSEHTQALPEKGEPENAVPETDESKKTEIQAAEPEDIGTEPKSDQANQENNIKEENSSSDNSDDSGTKSDNQPETPNGVLLVQVVERTPNSASPADENAPIQSDAPAETAGTAENTENTDNTETPSSENSPAVSNASTAENAVAATPEPPKDGSNGVETAGKVTELFVPQEQGEQVQSRIIEQLAHLGAILLLFSIGINFSPSELIRIWRFFVVGGSIQMVTVPLVITLAFVLAGYDWKAGVFLGSVAALSSTVLVFKSLEEFGQATSPHGLRAVAILLFQDIAVVPLLLLIPLLSASDTSLSGTFSNIIYLLLKSAIFVSFVMLLRYIFSRWVIDLMSGVRSVELMVLFTLMLLVGVSIVAMKLDLSAALGALAAGVILSENRLTHQIKAITVPFRETFSAIFFVSLGALFDYSVLL